MGKAALIFLALAFQSVAQRLFISKYIHGGKNLNRNVLEIFNPSCIDVRLNQFGIIIAKDGMAWNFGSLVKLSTDPEAMLAGGGTWRMGTDDFVSAFYGPQDQPEAMNNVISTTWTPEYDQTSKVIAKEGGIYYEWFDGNDAIALVQNGQIIDQIGDELDSRRKTQYSGWMIAGVRDATVQHWLSRKSWVKEGNMGVWKERGHNKNASEWTVESVPTSATDARISTIGTHSVDTLKFPCMVSKLTCAATGLTLGATAEMATVVCPPNCHLKPGKVIGAGGTYSIESAICKAAIHANVTKLVKTPGMPEVGHAHQEWSDDDGETEIKKGMYGKSNDQIPAKADIIILAPNGIDFFWNHTDGLNGTAEMSWTKMISHLKYVSRQFLFYSTNKFTRIAFAGYSNALIPAEPQFRNDYVQVQSDIDNGVRYNKGSKGEKVGDALRLACDKLIKYRVDNASYHYQSPRPGANKFLIVYMRHAPNSTEKVLMSKYIQCFTDIGFEVLTIGNSTTGWGTNYDNKIATSRDSHYMFQWEQPMDSGFGSEELYQFIFRNIWDAQRCWDRSYQTSQEKVYISYMGKQMPLDAMLGSNTKCVASYNRTHTTAAPTASPTYSPSASPTMTPTTKSPTALACSECIFVPDITAKVDIVTLPPTTMHHEEFYEPKIHDAFALTRSMEYKRICDGGVTCGGRGYCNFAEGYCECNPGHWGPGCRNINCPQCHNGGECDLETGKCTCPDPADVFGILYFGDDCLKVDCRPMDGTGERCSGRGDCNFDNGICECQEGFIGRHCEFKLCGPDGDNSCHGQGRCNWIDGSCQCYEGYYGKYCQFTKCASDCSDFGICDVETGRCSCEPFTHENTAGGSCRFGYCPNDCSGHGVCDYFSRTCKCFDGWTLSDCSRPLPAKM